MTARPAPSAEAASATLTGERDRAIAHQWHVHSPPGEPDPAGDWLGPIRRFRAEVLFDNGRRPAFRDRDGTFHDDDPADLVAYHVTVTQAGDLIAVLRVVPIATTREGVCERLLGSDRVNRFLDRLGLDRANVWEGSGWAVDPARRGGALGARVVAAGASVAARLGMATSIGAVGTRYGQLYRLLTIGYRCADGCGPVPVPDLADDLQFVYATLPEMEPDFQRMTAGIASQLQWATTSPATQSSDRRA